MRGVFVFLLFLLLLLSTFWSPRRQGQPQPTAATSTTTATAMASAAALAPFAYYHNHRNFCTSNRPGIRNQQGRISRSRSSSRSSSSIRSMGHPFTTATTTMATTRFMRDSSTSSSPLSSLPTAAARVMETTTTSSSHNNNSTTKTTGSGGSSRSNHNFNHPNDLVEVDATTAPETKSDPPSQQQQQQQLFPSQQHYDSLPFSLFVNHALAKQALIVAAVDPTLSVLFAGPTGAGKSVLARSLYPLLPPKKQVVTTTTKSNTSHHRNNNNGSTAAQQQPQPSLLSPSPPRLITVPLHCQEDALLGTVDLEKSLESGQTCFEPGLLFQAHNGMLLVDDVNLLEAETRHILLNALQDGFVHIEREGMSTSYPCQPLFVATINPAEGGSSSELDDSMQAAIDRMAIVMPVLSSDLTLAERVHVVQHVEGFLDHTDDNIASTAVQQDDELRIAIARARGLLSQVQITREQLLYLCQEATRADCQGQRGEIYATKIAKAAAAVQGRTTVVASDLQLGVLLAIAPRARNINWTSRNKDEPEPSLPQDEEEAQQQPPMPPQMIPPPPPPPPETMQQEEDTADLPEEEDEEEQPTPEEEPDLDELMLPQSFMFGVDSTPIDPRLLLFKQWTRKGKGGKRSRIFNLTRGRFVQAVFPKGMNQGRIAVGATLRAAAPFQKSRLKYATEHLKASPRLVYIRDDDIRIQRLKRKAGSLIIFVVDASGSMALNRMGAAKGAAMTLLQEAYKSRDKICLIAFHDDKADVVVPPTKSIALTRARLEEIPCGGRSPLAHALVTALRTGLNAIKVKQDVGKVVMVLITDGRPTVPLCESEGDEFDAALMDPDAKNGTPSRTYCRNEVLAIARQLGAVDDLNLLVVDTEDKYVSTGVAQQIAGLALGNYYALGSIADLAALTREAVEQG